MTNSRRAFLKKLALLTGSSYLSGYAVRQAHSNPIYDPSIKTQSVASENFPDNTGKLSGLIDTDKIDIKLPKIAEKNASIPITVTSSLADVETLTILVEKNRVPLVASFKLSADLKSVVSARLALLESSDVIVIVKTKTGSYRAKEFVKVIAGGCSG